MIRVLIVDDDALTVELHREFVHRIEGFEVRGECGDARSALSALFDYADAPRFDLVLLDVTMPDGTGVDVLRQIRGRGSSIDVIAITGVRDADIVRQMVSLGVAHYLVKPFTFAAFRERMEQFRDYRERASRTAGKATQHEIDALLEASRPAGKAPLPKGLSVDTLTRVVEVIREPGALSATEVAGRLGMSRVAARRYLEHLCAEGCAGREPRYGGAGRPETAYRWTV
ncbi:MAG: response regulator [Microcella sp.]